MGAASRKRRECWPPRNTPDFGRFKDVDLAIAGGGESSLPLLTERVKAFTRSGRKNVFADRGKALAQAHAASLEQLKTQATIGWDASPITTARLCAELY